MTAKRNVINSKYLPTRLPFIGTAFWIFLLHYFKAPGWVWGVVLTVFAIVWPLFIFVKLTEKEVFISEVDKR